MQNSGSVAGFLSIHTEVNDIEQDLHVSLWLCCPAHDTEAEEWVAIFGNESGNDRMEGAFAWRIGVHATGLEVKHFTTILEGEAESSGADT